MIQVISQQSGNSLSYERGLRCWVHDTSFFSYCHDLLTGIIASSPANWYYYLLTGVTASNPLSLLIPEFLFQRKIGFLLLVCLNPSVVYSPQCLDKCKHFRILCKHFQSGPHLPPQPHFSGLPLLQGRNPSAWLKYQFSQWVMLFNASMTSLL